LSSKFISFEGIDGSGKSTQIKLFSERLKKHGIEHVLSREPGGSKGAEEIRRLLVEGDPDRWSHYTEMLLFTAARRDHLERTINPNLESGKTVVTDRFADSTRVYQGAAREGMEMTVNALHNLMIRKDPDITFIIDIDPEIALKRGLARNSGEDRFEEFGLEFQKKLRKGFLSLASHFNKRCFIIDGDGELDIIFERIWTTYQDNI
jgi:dTMP kinase